MSNYVYKELAGEPHLVSKNTPPAISLVYDHNDNIIAELKKFIIEQNQVVDWDGVEPLRRNHLVTLGTHGDKYTIESIDGNADIVCVKSVSDGKLYLASMSRLQPVKPSLEYLYEQWLKLPVSTPPTTPDGGLWEREQRLSFVKYVQDHERT